MNFGAKPLVPAILLLFTTNCTKQKVNLYYNKIVETKPAIITPVSTAINANCGGFYKALPYLYDSTTKNYPLLISLHGKTELGDGIADLSKLLNNSVPGLLNNKTFPPSFNVGGNSYSFVVMAPQFKEWPSTTDMNDVVDYAIRNFRIDDRRIYIVGLSMGGGITWEYGAAYKNRLAAIVPICGASLPDDTRAHNIASALLPVWGFHNDDDSTVLSEYTKEYVTKINSYDPHPAARKTIWPTGGHDAWTKATDPSYKENDKNIYEWMLQYKR